MEFHSEPGYSLLLTVLILRLFKTYLCDFITQLIFQYQLLCEMEMKGKEGNLKVMYSSLIPVAILV